MDVTYADKENGVFMTADNTLFFTNPGTFNIKGAPFPIFEKSRVIPSGVFVIVVTESARIYVFSHETGKCVYNIDFPTGSGIVKEISVDLINGKPLLEMITDKGVYKFDGVWTQLKGLWNGSTITPEMRTLSKCAELENEINISIAECDIEHYRESVLRYLVYLAQAISVESFIASWFDLIQKSLPFDKQQINDTWINTIAVFREYPKLANYCDELEMSITEYL